LGLGNVYLGPIRNYMQKPIGNIPFSSQKPTGGIFYLIALFRVDFLRNWSA